MKHKIKLKQEINDDCFEKNNLNVKKKFKNTLETCKKIFNKPE